jgi:hypothetical protein
MLERPDNRAPRNKPVSFLTKDGVHRPPTTDVGNAAPSDIGRLIHRLAAQARAPPWLLTFANPTANSLHRLPANPYQHGVVRSATGRLGS